MELLVPIIAALIGGGLAAFITAWFGRKKTKAETQATIADTAMRIMQQTLENTVDPLNKRVDKLEVENQELIDSRDRQAIAIENLNGQYLKLQLAYTIISGQLKQLGHIPAIALEDLDRYTIDELRDMAQSMHNVVKRRQMIDDKSD